MANSLTIFLAIWGAVLGTIGTVISVILATREFKKDKYKIKIWADFSPGDGLHSIGDQVIVTVLNIGFRPVQIRSVRLRFDNRYEYRGCNLGEMKNGALPMTLSEGMQLEMYFEISNISYGVKRFGSHTLIAEIMDGEGGIHEHVFSKAMIEVIQQYD